MSKAAVPESWFVREKEAYDSKLADWLRQGLNGQFVVIEGATILGICKDYEEALSTGLAHRDLGEFMVQRIQPADTVEWMSHIAS